MAQLPQPISLREALGHLAAARAKGMTAAEQAELLRLVGTAAKTNHLLNAIRPPIDAAFLADGE